MNAPLNPSLQKFTAETITAVRPWTDRLFSFRTTRYRAFRFVAGQFARIGIPEAGGAIVWRPYSMVSAPSDEHLEFYSIVVPGGRFTGRLSSIRVGDELLIDRTSYGFLTPDRFPGKSDAPCDLWMLASGTGIAPFVSILHDPDVWMRFGRIVLVHSVRETAELAYREQLADLAAHPLVGPLLGGPLSARFTQIPIVTRDPGAAEYGPRMTARLADGSLESAAALSLDPERSRIMVCGNPEMVAEVRARLSARGFRTSRRSEPGQMAFENYW